MPYKSASKGFEPVAERSGMFIAFAMALGAVALDEGQARASGGPYATALADELVKPGQDHLQLFQNVKEDVYASTSRRQVPWERNGLLRRIYFAAPVKPPTPAIAQPQSSEAEREWQQYGKDTKDIRLLEAFKEKHKSDLVYARLAEVRIEELAMASAYSRAAASMLVAGLRIVATTLRCMAHPPS